MIKTNSLQKQQNKERNEKENRKKIAKILPQIEVFMKGLPNFTIFKKLIDLQILHFEFEVIKIFSNKKFLPAFYHSLVLVNAEVDNERPATACAYLKELRKYLQKRMFQMENLDYCEILNFESNKTKGIYEILWDMLTLEFTFYHNDFKHEVETLLWMFFREKGIKDVPIDERWKNLTKMAKPASRAFDGGSQFDALSQSGKVRIHDGDSEYMSEYQSTHRNKYSKKRSDSRKKVRIRTDKTVSKLAESMGRSEYSGGSDRHRNRTSHKYEDRDAEASFADNESQQNIDEINVENMDWKDCCLTVIDRIEELEEADDFKRPVTKEDLGEFWDEYKATITYPVDLTSVRAKIYEGEYAGVGNFEFDMRKLFDNCKKFNDPNSGIYENAIVLEDLFQKLFRPVKKTFGENKKLKDAGIKISIGGIGI